MVVKTKLQKKNGNKSHTRINGRKSIWALVEIRDEKIRSLLGNNIT